MVKFLNKLNDDEIKELQDYKGTLGDFCAILEKLRTKYGNDREIYFDAGYNNVSVRLRKEKK